MTLASHLRRYSSFGVAMGVALAISPAAASPPRDEALRVFAEADALCKRDGGRFWGRSLCGPILLVDWRDRGVIANTADPGGVLKASGGVFVGTLPDSVIIANTPTKWSGLTWTQLVSPVPGNAGELRVLLAHELFHRIQGELGLSRPEQANHHLDTLEGRYLLQLEWRALARALSAGHTRAEREAIADALLFRQQRYRLFPSAAAEEQALEINEGIPEYTGVMLGLRNRADRVAFALSDLTKFTATPTFVRSFAYATGPAYGLLLDRADPRWRTRLAGGQRLDALLAAGTRTVPLPAEAVATRAKIYDDGKLRSVEEARERVRQERLAGFRAALINGPVLILPLAKTNVQFNPQTLVAIDGVGTVYPTMRLTDEWGALQVESGGALIRRSPRQATVSLRGIDPARTQGDGWTLKLAAGWTIVAGSRSGDLVVQRASDGKP